MQRVVGRSGDSPGTPSPPVPPSGPAGDNLPFELTRFVGRHAERAAVAAALDDDRLVTLTGPGGCGKTRLATRVAADVAGRFPHGCRFVDLATVDGELLVPLVAHAVRVREQPASELLETLVAALGPRRLLLVLDNCEHIAETVAPFVMTLLRGCPDLRILATSRRQLGLPGEVVWQVPPLEQGDAIRLFLERARQRRPGFGLTPQVSQAVAAICRGLDGLPLAIELATARITVLSVEEIAAMLSDQLALLTTGDRGVDPRHESLEAALRWSYDLLTKAQRRAFARLSVFAGWWGRESVAAVVGDDRGALDLLGALVDNSLVTTETVAGTMRYRMLEPVRQFGAAQLRGDDAAAARDAHAAFAIGLADQAGGGLRGTAQLEWLRRLDDAEPDLRAALAWLQSRGDAERMVGLGWSMWVFWWLRGRFTEGRRAMEHALAAPLSDRDRARAAFVAGTMACGQADYGWATRQLDESVRLASAVGDHLAETFALTSSGFAAIGAGDRDRGAELLERGMDLAASVGEWWAESFLSCFLGVIARSEGDGERAAAFGRRSLELAAAGGDREGQAMASYLLAALARDGGRAAEAARHFREGLRLAAETGDAPYVAFCLQGLAALVTDDELAVRLWSAADALLSRSDSGGYLVQPDSAAIGAALRIARARLGEPAFAAAWEAGQALRPVELLAVAVGAPFDVPAGPDPDGLTAREAQVLDLIAAGSANKEIAAKLSISVSTVEQHVTRLYTKIGARGRADATVHALRRGTRRA